MGFDMSYAGIDYGMGKSNIDTETGIRYGIVSMNSLNEWAWESMEQGDDLDYDAFKKEVISSLSSSIREALEQYSLDYQNDSDAIADDVWDGLEVEYESNGDCRRYALEEDGCSLQTTSSGDLFVFKSPFYTHAQFCSPCVPGAGNLDCPCENGPKTYCIGWEWYDEEQPCPYPIYRCDTGEQVYAPKREESNGNS
jgi:hypothetical protein